MSETGKTWGEWLSDATTFVNDGTENVIANMNNRRASKKTERQVKKILKETEKELAEMDFSDDVTTSGTTINEGIESTESSTASALSSNSVQYEDRVYNGDSGITIDSDNRNIGFVTPMDDPGKNSIYIPQWGVKDYIAERTAFQKGTESLAGGIGYCYFKIFFDFTSEYGLLGGMLSDADATPASSETISAGSMPYGNNTAAKYLSNLMNNTSRFSDAEITNITGRLAALKQFANTLSYITKNAPWFFKEVSGVDDATSINLNEPCLDKNLDIICSPDAIDMRLTALLDLYKYACYDVVNHREIIPENLRKFNMQVVAFQVPIKNIHTGVGKYGYKSFNDSTLDNIMSFKMVTFQNCEINVKTTKNLPSSMNNERAFELNDTIHLTYERAYEHNFNEWMKFFINGGDFKSSEDFGAGLNERLSALKNARETGNTTVMVEESEKLIHDAYGKVNNKNYLASRFTNPVSGVSSSSVGFDKKVDGYGLLHVPYGITTKRMVQTGLDSKTYVSQSYKYVKPSATESKYDFGARGNNTSSSTRRTTTVSSSTKGFSFDTINDGKNYVNPVTGAPAGQTIRQMSDKGMVNSNIIKSFSFRSDAEYTNPVSGLKPHIYDEQGHIMGANNTTINNIINDGILDSILD